MASLSFELSSDPIEGTSSAALASAGGYVVFEGRVRDHNEGRNVLSLEYDSFDEMALKTGRAILEEAASRFPIVGAACIHRTGHLHIGDMAIRVEVACAHRKEAFEACDWIVDEVKRRVPIWKKEHYEEGDSGWINCESPAMASEDRYYSRQTILREIGAEGQAKLKAARVLVVGAGGLGSPASLYLAAAGVGTIGIVEFDRLDESNLQRQILYASDDVGRPKSDLAVGRLRELNPYVEVRKHEERLDRTNASELLSRYDVVLDCTDNFRTKFLLNDLCAAGGKVLIQASIYRYEGQLLVVEPGSACLRCLWQETPEEGCIGSCAEVGVLGVVPGVFGTLQAAEAIKLIVGLPSPLREGKMLLFDVLTFGQQLVSIRQDPGCPTCGSGVSDNSSCSLEWGEVQRSSTLFVDVREEFEAALDPIDCDLTLPISRFDAGVLPQAERYLLICTRGVRSETLARSMRDRGDPRFFSLAGGIPAMRAKRG